MIEINDNPNWDLEIPLVMGAVERGALAHRIRAWGAQQFAAGKAAALAELHPHWEAEKQRADRLQAQANEAAFDKLLSEGSPVLYVRQRDIDGTFKREDLPVYAYKTPSEDWSIPLYLAAGTAAAVQTVDPVRCSHQWEWDGHQGFKAVWRCSKCGKERKR